MLAVFLGKTMAIRGHRCPSDETVTKSKPANYRKTSSVIEKGIRQLSSGQGCFHKWMYADNSPASTM